MAEEKIVVYGHDFCPHVRWMTGVLEEHQIEYEWRDVRTGDPRFRDELRELANGNLSVPTILFADGTVMVEPQPEQVLRKLGYVRKGWLTRLLRRWRETLDAVVRRRKGGYCKGGR